MSNFSLPSIDRDCPSISQGIEILWIILFLPFVEGFAANAEVSARFRHITTLAIAVKPFYSLFGLLG